MCESSKKTRHLNKIKHKQNVTKFKRWEMVQQKNRVGMASSPTKRVNPVGDDDDDDVE